MHPERMDLVINISLQYTHSVHCNKLSKSLIWRVKNSGFHSENTSRDITCVQ